MEHTLAIVVVFGMSIVGAIVSIGQQTIKNVLKSQERRMELQIQAQQGQNTALAQEVATLRAEVSELRDTSTQFNLSIDHTVQTLAERVDGNAARRAPHIPATPPEEVQQNIGRL